jgi:hypothetical protein
MSDEVPAAPAPAPAPRRGGYALTAATSAWIVDENVAGGADRPFAPDCFGRDDPEGAPWFSLSRYRSLASLSSAADLSAMVRSP